MPVTPLRPSDPAQVGPHRLLARLGQGGMGTVYLGVSPDERAVAVKVLRDGIVDPSARRRFRHELDALRRVRGPHLVEVLDADVDADTPFLVTRFVPGTRLDDLVAHAGPLADDDLHSVARGLADALTALHAAGVVHRDLTPGNVLVLDGQPHVIDLGLATAADITTFTRSGLVIGTPGYLAPEQVTGSAVTPAVDVHAWGATVALAGTGRPPYGTGRPEAVLYRIVHGEPDVEGLPDRLAELVAAAMDPDPGRRPDARTLLAALGGTTAAEPVIMHLPRDVDATSVLGLPELVADPAADGPAATAVSPGQAVDTAPTDELVRPTPTRTLTRPVRELAGVASGPGATLAPALRAGSLAAGSLAAGSRTAGPVPATSSPAAAPLPSRPPVRRGDDGPSGPPSSRRRPARAWESDDQGAEAVTYGPVAFHDPRHLDRPDPGGHEADAHDPDGGVGPHPDLTVPSHPARELQVVATGAAAVAVVGAATLVAPVLGAIGALALLVLLRAAGRGSDRLRDRRVRRGGRRRDPVVAALGAPWHAVLAAVDTLISLPLLAAVAAVPAGAVWLLDPAVSGLERPELTAATGVVAALLTGLGRHVHRRSRRMLRSTLRTLTPGTASGVAVLASLGLTALLLLATAEGSAPVWWPWDSAAQLR